MAEQLNKVAKRGPGRPRKNQMMPPVPTYAEMKGKENGHAQQEPEQQPRQQETQSDGIGPSNITDDTIRELSLDALRHWNEKEDAQKTLKSAVGSLRAVFKRAKKLGGEKTKEAIEEWLKERLMDPADLNAKINAKNRQWLVLQLPVGTQLGLYDSSTTIASQLEKNQREQSEKSAVDQAADAYDRCYEAGKLGHAISRTGYNEASEVWSECLRGYAAGQKELMSRSGAPTASREDQPAEGSKPH